VSNVHLVTTSDGDVIINAGMPEDGERAAKLFAPHRTGPVRYVILTKAMPTISAACPSSWKRERKSSAGPTTSRCATT
jgi:hypothetical protein